MVSSKGKKPFGRPLSQLKLFPGKAWPHQAFSPWALLTTHGLMLTSDSVPKFGRCWVRRSYQCCFLLLVLAFSLRQCLSSPGKCSTPSIFMHHILIQMHSDSHPRPSLSSNIKPQSLVIWWGSPYFRCHSHSLCLSGSDFVCQIKLNWFIYSHVMPL